MRFAVHSSEVSANKARVPVRFADGHGEKWVTYVLTREGGAWRVAELFFEKGESLTHLLSQVRD